MKNQKILVTGPTGQVALPTSLALARDNEVWGVARFTDAAARKRLEAAGVRCVAADLGAGDFRDLPGDFDYVLNLAVAKSPDGDFEKDLRGNGEAAGLLMSHCRRAKAFLHCSTTGVYQAAGHHVFRESDALGDNHRSIMPTYSIAKIATEVVVRTMARELRLPTTIARLCVPYGDNGGWPWYHLLMMKGGVAIPVHATRPSRYTPIHEDDIIGSIPGLLRAASVPATIVNWGGQEHVSIEEWCEYLGELTGLEPRCEVSPQALDSVQVDTTRLVELVGPAKVSWKEGFRRMVEARAPELLRKRA
ncbi:MAG TPA: NAD(P)-dependent oxidoreductase [Myxococcota bacterium]|nr:NAD(P)-dependent oxidoreductase [Myxococcota bacterium]